MAAPFNLASVFVRLAVRNVDVRSAQAATYDRQLLFHQGEVRRKLTHRRLANDDGQYIELEICSTVDREQDMPKFGSGRLPRCVAPRFRFVLCVRAPGNPCDRAGDRRFPDWRHVGSVEPTPASTNKRQRKRRTARACTPRWAVLAFARTCSLASTPVSNALLVSAIMI
jgi:hypothetical protein